MYPQKKHFTLLASFSFAVAILITLFFTSCNCPHCPDSNNNNPNLVQRQGGPGTTPIAIASTVKETINTTSTGTTGSTGATMYVYADNAQWSSSSGVTGITGVTGLIAVASTAPDCVGDACPCTAPSGQYDWTSSIIAVAIKANRAEEILFNRLIDDGTADMTNLDFTLQYASTPTICGATTPVHSMFYFQSTTGNPYIRYQVKLIRLPSTVAGTGTTDDNGSWRGPCLAVNNTYCLQVLSANPVYSYYFNTYMPTGCSGPTGITGPTGCSGSGPTGSLTSLKAYIRF